MFAYAVIYVLRDADIGIPPDNLFILIYISFGCLIVLYRKTAWKQDMPITALWIYIALLTWNCVAMIRGMLTAADYLDWKN
ncbi:MAG TPA: hypothetical protein VLJ68_13310, partial [Chitinophagaceae bacterium]|nr:hypothetical protein [Chitinophagaceae bacterium]